MKIAFVSLLLAAATSSASGVKHGINYGFEGKGDTYADAIAKKQRDRNKDVGGVSRLRGAFEVGGGGDIASKTGVVKSDGVDEDAILEEDAVSKKQLQINDMGKTNKLLDDELDAFVNEAEAVEDDEGVDHPDVGVSLSTGSTEVEEEEENNDAIDSGEKEDGVEEDDDTGKGVTTFNGASLAVLSAICPAGEEKCVGYHGNDGYRACQGADKSKIECGSCIYSYACYVNTGTVGEGSCIGSGSCQSASATIGDRSCNAGGACSRASATIGEGSCNGGAHACYVMKGNVGNNACNGGAHACWKVGYNGDGIWQDGYEGDIPDNCPSIAALERGECPTQPPTPPPTSTPTPPPTLPPTPHPTPPPTPPTPPNETKWYPDYQTGWMEAGCLNDIPLPFSPGDRPMYDSELECCNACYAGQPSGACLAV